MMAKPALIRMEMIGRLQHRDLVLRSVAAACKLVTPPTDTSALQEFRMQVVTAVGEAFNNIVLHSYAGRDDGVVEMDIKTEPDQISIEFRDWGDSFDPDAVPLPDLENLENLPESGLGIFIIRTLMEISYAPGHPNVLTLSKSLRTQATESYQAPTR
jgi:anti-sigma regulatory factor (Ser/Thr protein kinase)